MYVMNNGFVQKLVDGGIPNTHRVIDLLFAVQLVVLIMAIKRRSKCIKIGEEI